MLDAGDVMNTPAFPHPQASQTRPSATMADVFSSFPGDPGVLAAAVQERVQAAAPLLPVHVHVPGFEDEPRVRPLPYRDPLAWSWLKHLVQAALVGAVLMFVTHGGNDPLMAGSYVATALLLVGIVVVADRLRFADRDPAMEIVEFIVPAQPQQAAQPRPVAPLVPLVEQMQVAMAGRVDVT